MMFESCEGECNHVTMFLIFPVTEAVHGTHGWLQWQRFVFGFVTSFSDPDLEFAKQLLG